MSRFSIYYYTESPRFILNLDTDDVKWLDDDLPELLGTDDEAELTTAISNLWQKQMNFTKEKLIATKN